MSKRVIDEKEIVRQILLGKEKSLRRFYIYFKPSLSGFIAKKISDRQDAEEILQDTFLATIDALRDFSFKCSLFTFICSIANHKIIDFYRKKRIKKIVFSKFVEIEPLLATFFGPEDALDEQILKQKIIATFQKISPNYQVILKLKYIQGYSVTEIARRLSLTFKSTESQLFRARKAFVQAYHEKG